MKTKKRKAKKKRMRVNLKPQRKNPERTSVYINGRYAFSVDKETLAHLGLYEQEEISKPEFDKLIYEAEKQKAKDYAFRLLTYRMRSIKELESRLQRKEFSGLIISDVMKELETLGLIDDKKFAQAFASDKLNLGLKGKRLIFVELIKKGIDAPEIKNVLNNIEESQEQEVCKRLIQKYGNRYRKLPAGEKKQKLYALLTRRGFSYPTIKNALKIEDE
jgi:regulatory protein